MDDCLIESTDDVEDGSLDNPIGLNINEGLPRGTHWTNDDIIETEILHVTSDGETEHQENTDYCDGLSVAEPFSSTISCYKSRPCAVCMYLLIAIVTLAAGVTVVVIGFLVAAPYARVSSFNDALCTTFSSSVKTDYRQCSCGKGCNSRYPCLRINVYSEFSSDTPSLLFDNEATLSKQVRKSTIFIRFLRRGTSRKS